MPEKEVVNRGHGPFLLRLANLNLTALDTYPVLARLNDSLLPKPQTGQYIWLGGFLHAA